MTIMRELGFIAALILILCCMTYFTRQTVIGVPPDVNSANSTYGPAIKAAENAKQIAGAESRRRWVLSLQLTVKGEPSAENPTYTAEGENSEILAVTSNSMDSRVCLALANGDQGSAAASVGFIDVRCRNSSSGAVYNVPISRSR
jgi:hypothetical protein